MELGDLEATCLRQRYRTAVSDADSLPATILNRRTDGGRSQCISGWQGFLLASLITLFLTSCLSSPAEAPPERTGDSYEESMWSQGYVELIGDFMVPPEMPDNPSQADLGREQYRQICLACHGDWGQGLTPVWRSEWQEDANCWQARCHAASHPDWGFELPHTVPPVMGPGALVGFDDAQELHQHIYQTMPWWNPGGLTEEQAWLITAFLMRERGEIGDDVELDRGNAAVFKLRTPYVAPPNPAPGAAALLALLLVATFSLVRRRDGQTP